MDTEKETKGNTEDNTTADAEAKIVELQEQLAKATEILEKARKGERYRGKERDELKVQLEDALKYKTLYETAEQQRLQLIEKQNTKLVDEAINKVLTEHKARSIPTVAKLLDRNVIVGDKVDAEKLAKQVEELKKSDPILFEQAEVPKPLKGSEQHSVNSLKSELESATTQKQIEAILRKHGKL